MPIEFFSASLQLQVAFGAGYIGYLAANAGLRDHHKQLDIAFITIAFGLVATMPFLFIQPRFGTVFAVLAAFLASATAGALWRKVFRDLIRKAFSRAALSYVDDDPSVLTTFFRDTKHHVTQALVVLDDGTELMCADTGSFADAPFGPVVMGADGSIALCVTDVYKKVKDDQIHKPQSSVREVNWGVNYSIVPASSIRQIDLRYAPKR
ncbi:hypothetical protein [Hoeflea ulvae]|uniref:Uncharacterized protein n=1 Tax=Hoeflea ulvae TaxID=2983764 RepID=A0ABT3YFD8_9HYPH|nr:hypothetical protein [Hoeflea ulvae]MCY0094600.1 hypothetical protein [Hoeflea ulvae]